MAELKEKSMETDQLRQLIKIDNYKMDQYHFKAASCSKEFLSALKLVQDVYTKEGYVNEAEASCSCRILENHFFEKTTVFVGKKKEKIIFTVSLFPDSPNGLPMDEIYNQELDHLRHQGRKIGEVGCLATHPEFRDGSQNIPMYGNKIMFKYAMEYLKLDDLVITVHPKHEVIYKEILMFEELGKSEIKPYPKVNGNPAVALRLNLHEAEEKCRHFYQNNPIESNLHHFLFIKQSDTLQLPEKDRVMENNFSSFIRPSHLEWQKRTSLLSNSITRQASCF